METISVNYDLYKYSELKPDIQKKVLTKLYDINVSHNDWYDFIYDEFALTVKRAFKTELNTKNDIHFSLGGCQGDGASFDFSVNRKIGPHVVRFYTVKNHYANHYCHKHTRTIEYEIESSYANFTPKMDLKLDKMLESFKERYLTLCDKLWHNLNNSYDYSTSDKAIIETINCNDYTFLACGKMFNK